MGDIILNSKDIIFYNGVKDVKAICEEPVSRCPQLGRQRCPRDTTWRSAQKSSRLSTLKPIKSFWTAPGGQERPPFTHAINSLVRLLVKSG
ncbi:hypothetical protein CDAR_182121 [Caerostris darwini]|uniref:Uncharacterized protein n=1 Tax=Caerostris darwini TaxID=1538125 RepID=A0AAV4U5H0_9ARAC|nr:hypothetical protein CDAR_182121 [Caerostris darwini]